MRKKKAKKDVQFCESYDRAGPGGNAEDHAEREGDRAEPGGDAKDRAESETSDGDRVAFYQELIGKYDQFLSDNPGDSLCEVISEARDKLAAMEL